MVSVSLTTSGCYPANTLQGVGASVQAADDTLFCKNLNKN